MRKRDELFAEAVENGLRWKVLKHEVRQLFPEALTIIQVPRSSAGGKPASKTSFQNQVPPEVGLCFSLNEGEVLRNRMLAGGVRARNRDGSQGHGPLKRAFLFTTPCSSDLRR